MRALFTVARYLFVAAFGAALAATAGTVYILGAAEKAGERDR